MTKLLSLSKAARLAGVSRAEIQNKVREWGAKTFEGKLTTALLLELYPHLDMEADPVLDRLEKIKAEARPKSRYGDGWIPETEMLMSRLQAFHRILAVNKSLLDTTESEVKETLIELDRAMDTTETHLQSSVAVCISRLEKLLQQIRQSTKATDTHLERVILPKADSACVRVLSSGHEFFVDGSDSILEAALKAGLSMDYGCSSRTCGKCKCKVIFGSVQKMQSHDYLLSERERREGFILACCYTATSNLVIEAAEAGREEELPYQEVRSIVRKITREGENLALLQIKTPRSQSLRFKAGQRVKIATQDGNVEELYIASCPCDGRNLQFIVTRQPGNVFSDGIFEGSLAKQTVTLKGPRGHFVLPEEPTFPILFVASGRGFAPIKSLVEQAINIVDHQTLHLIQLGCIPTGSHLDNLCHAWNDALDNFFYTAVPADTCIAELIERLASAISGFSQMVVYLAGPETWLNQLLEAARLKRLAPEGWHCEAIE